MDERFVHDLCKAPAGIRNHHAYLGGLLEHVVTLLDAADRIAPLYPELDRDLLLTGVFLHDIGKVRELSYGRSFGYTDEGQLVGHLVIGVEMLNEKAAQVPDLTGEPFPPELLLRLKHMILSHHGTLRVRQSPAADDAGSDRAAPSGQLRRQGAQFHARHPRRPERYIIVDAL